MNKTTNRLSETISSILSVNNQDMASDVMQLCDAVKNIEQFLSMDCTFQELQDDIHESTIAAFSQYMEKNDRDERPFALCYCAKQMLDLLRPFASIMGQAEERRVAC